MGMRLPDSCYCISLRAVSVIIGIILLVFSLMFFLSSLVWAITYRSIEYSHHGDAIVNPDPLVDVIEILSFEYGSALEIMFSIFLIYGGIKESSSCTCSWVICQLVMLINAVLNVLVNAFKYHHFYFHELISIGIVIGMMFTVYCYYNTLPKRITT